MRKHLPAVCAQEMGSGNLEEALSRDCLVFLQSGPINNYSSPETQSLGWWVDLSPPCFTTGEIHHPLPTPKAVLKLQAVVIDLTSAYLAQCTVHRLLRFTAAIKESPSISSSWVFLCTDTLTDVLWGLLHYRDRFVTERGVDTFSNHQMNCQVQVWEGQTGRTCLNTETKPAGPFMAELESNGHNKKQTNGRRNIMP